MEKVQKSLDLKEKSNTIPDALLKRDLSKLPSRHQAHLLTRQRDAIAYHKVKAIFLEKRNARKRHLSKVFGIGITILIAIFIAILIWHWVPKSFM